MANVAQLVRASVCGTEGRGFNSHHSPQVFIDISMKNPKKGLIITAIVFVSAYLLLLLTY